jgi:hypothetical protein
MKSSRATSHVRIYKEYDVSGTDSFPQNVVFFKYSDAAGNPRRFHQTMYTDVNLELSHLFKTTGKIIVLYILIFTLLYSKLKD